MTRRAFSRAVVIVMDGVGVGELPDADEYGDAGANTVAHIAASQSLEIPFLARLGLSRLVPELGPVNEPSGAFGKMGERSPGKDSTTGHWEMAGIVLEKAFRTFPDGFPVELIAGFEERIGRKVLGNRAASGTVIIQELGEEHRASGMPIVYTSADSVFQIAAHEDVVPVDQLYEMCQVAFDLAVKDYGVARIIARPFVGEEAGAFVRTPRRRDFVPKPPGPTLLDRMAERGLEVFGVGKIEDIFAGSGVSAAVHTDNNSHGITETVAAMKRPDASLIFTNLVDFDQEYGHRNDPEGFARALEELDGRMPELMDSARDDDLIVLTADHGCDPTTPSTDHSREYVPVLAAGRKVRAGADLGVRDSFADLGQTLAEVFGVGPLAAGTSFLEQLAGTD